MIPEKKIISVFRVYKETTTESVFCQAFGVQEIEIPDDIIKKHGKIVKKSEPDILMIAETTLVKFAREAVNK